MQPRKLDTSPAAAGPIPLSPLAERSGAVMLALLSLLCAIFVPLAGSTRPALVAGGAAWIALLWAFVLARGGGYDWLLYAADLTALVLLAGLVAAGGRVDGRALVGAMVVPVLHSAVFQPKARAAALAVLAAGLAPAGLAIAGREVVAPLVWMLPALGAAALAAVPVTALRVQIERLARREAVAQRLADEDALTGVANYRVFWRMLQAETARSLRHGNPFSLAIFDLDEFKLINDEHGHQVGDQTLRAVADALRDGVRTEDVVCRQGGDEFAVVAVAAGEQAIAALVERLVRAVASAPGSGLPRRVTASAGMATFGVSGRTPEELVEAAGRSLREAKAQHRGIAAQPRAAMFRSAGASESRAQEPSQLSPSVRLAVLGNLARALGGARGERAIAETTVAHVAGAVDARLIGVVRRTPGDGGLELVALGGPAAERLSGDYKLAERPPLATALREHRPALAGEEEKADQPAESSTAAPAATRLAVPVSRDDEVWGALTLESERPEAYPPRAVELVAAMAGQMGRSLVVSDLLEQLADADSSEEQDAALARAGRHGQDVAHLVSLVGRRLGLAEAEIRHLHLAALFHELGTVSVPAAVVDKLGYLTDEEFDALREHPVAGERLLGSLPGLAEAARIVRCERERYDGGGYPDGLARDGIPLTARILHACDAFVAMTTPRPYRAPLSRETAVEELRHNAGTQFDPDVVEALVGTLESPTEARAT